MTRNEALTQIFLLVLCVSMAITSGIKSELKAEQIRLLCELVVYILGLGTINLVVFGGRLNNFGIQPRTTIGLLGILFAPFLHVNWTHLIGNIVPFFILGWFIMLGGSSNFYIVTAFTVLVGGLGVWLFGRPNPHCGASGVIFGYLGFLLVRSYFERNLLSIVLSVIVGVAYSRLLWLVFPIREKMSWESHLFGFLSGVMAASYLDILKGMFPVS